MTDSQEVNSKLSPITIRNLILSTKMNTEGLFCFSRIALSLDDTLILAS